jgi:ketosteroid isomerase-like protein
MADENVEKVKSAYEAFDRGDIEAVLEALDDDIEWNVPAVLPHGAQAKGRDEVGEFFQDLAEKWSEFQVEASDFVSSGSRICVIGEARGKVEGVGASYGFVHAWTVDDEGALTKFEEFVDPSPELMEH